MMLFNILRWILINSSSTTSFRGLLRWAYEQLTKEWKTLRYTYTSQYEFWQYRHRLDRELRLKRGRYAPKAAARAQRFIHSFSLPTSSTLYKYRRLPSDDSFRCLELSPGSGLEPLHANLVIFNIGADVEYEAVSYKWTSHVFLGSIECERGLITITGDVEQMLRRLRLSNASRRLWIDSICINQKDELEKALQVARMADIYKNAYSTIIWLGEEDKTTESAFSMLRTLKDMNTLCEARFDADDPNGNLLTFEKLRAYGLPNVDDDRWKPLMSLLHRQWFTRTWILQEVTLARNPWILCGSHYFSWYDISRIISDLKNGNVDGQYNLYIDRAWRIGHLQALYLDSGGGSLLQLLYLAQFTGAKEYNDQIFAILGLARDEASIRPQLKYDKSLIIDNFTTVALHYLLTGHLEVLNYASDPSLRELQRLPSWVPDWSTDAPSIGLLSYISVDEPYGMRIPHQPPRRYPEIKNHPQRLCVPGIVADKVLAVGLHVRSVSKQSFLQIRMRSALLIFEQWRYLISKMGSYPTGEPILDAFANTLTLGRSICETGKSNAGLYGWHANDIGIRIDSFDPRESYSCNELEEYRRCLDYSSDRRTFFVTAQGYIGVGPYFVRPGDSVAYFEGGATPFIIRKSKSALYKMVGGTYIRGLMDRELDLAECGTIELI